MAVRRTEYGVPRFKYSVRETPYPLPEKLGPVFFLVTIPAQLLLALVLIHLLLALLAGPGHCFLRL